MLCGDGRDGGVAARGTARWCVRGDGCLRVAVVAVAVQRGELGAIVVQRRQRGKLLRLGAIVLLG